LPGASSRITDNRPALAADTSPCQTAGGPNNVTGSGERVETLRATSEDSIVGRRGFDFDVTYRTYLPGPGGVTVVQAEELDRIELRISRRSDGRRAPGGFTRQQVSNRCQPDRTSIRRPECSRGRPVSVLSARMTSCSADGQSESRSIPRAAIGSDRRWLSTLRAAVRT
jgi:hypothetical protein